MKHLKKVDSAAKNHAESIKAAQHMSPHQTTLSEIAARLRLVHGQMQQTPFESESDPQQSRNLRAHLNEMSRALLAEHHDRREWQKKLLERLEQIEQFQKKQAAKQAKQMNIEQLAKIEEIVQNAALKTQHNIQNAWAEQTKKHNDVPQNTAAVQNNSSFDQAVEQVKAPAKLGEQKKFSGQFIALQDQIMHLQQRLNESDKKPDRSIIYQLADLPLAKMADAFTPQVDSPIGQNKKQIQSIKKPKKSFLNFNPVRYVAVIVALAVVYGFYLQFTHLLNDLTILHL